MNRFNFSFALVGISFLCGCTTLQVDVPAPEVQLPEVNGKSWGVTYGIAGQPAMEVEITSNPNNRPPDLSAPRTKVSTALPGLLDVGIGSRFQGGIRAGLVSGAFIGHLVYQPIGKPAETSGKGNTSLSVYTRAGTVGGSKRGQQAVLFGPGGFPWRATANVAISGFGTSVGHRVTDQILVYSGFAADWYRATGEISHDVSADASSPAAVYSFSQSGQARSIALGLSSGKLASVSIQVLFNEFEWTNTKQISQFNYALYFRGSW